VAGHRHNPWSPHRRHSGLWAGVLAGCRDSIGEAIRIRPPDVHADQKDKKTTGVHSGWLIAHFDTCPEGAEDAAVHRFDRSYLCHMDDE
jgi:hypothetical protein